MTQNLFENDWRECLSAHLFHVIKERDVKNEDSLISVLIQTGYTEEEIAGLRTQTLIALGWYDPDQPAQEVAAEAPAEVVIEAINEMAAEPPQDDPASDVPEVEIEIKRPAENPPKNKPPKEEPPPVQMSMF